MESLFRERIYPLKSNSVITIRFAFTNLSSLRAENWLSPKIIILLIYMPTIPNKIPVVVIRKHKLNIKVVINSFSLWYLL
jgi:hypothetical protein